jgi:adenylate kinase family enzyme
MQVYALVGPSGTGKSYRAGIIAHDYNIPLIVDDGLLIWDGKILGGKSAKRENTRLAAIRRALFFDRDQAEEVKEKIDYSREEKILILGTSVRMVKQITRNLDLNEPDRLININQIASQEEIEDALSVRNKEGKHVIPVPTIEIKSMFPGYVVNPLILFMKKDNQSIRKEKSLVRPRFSYFGDLVIYEKVIIQAIDFLLRRKITIKRINGIKVNESSDGLKIATDLVLEYGTVIPDFIRQLQGFLKSQIEYFTGIGVLKIDVEVTSLYLQEG